MTDNWDRLQPTPSTLDSRTKRVLLYHKAIKTPCVCTSFATAATPTMTSGELRLDSLMFRVPSLSDDPGELHLPAGVHLEPVVSLLRLGAPPAPVQVIIISGAL